MNQYTSLITEFKKEQAFILCIYSLPILILFIFIKSFSINVPIGDDWALLSFFDSLKSGNLSFESFFAQHNEHRIFFPKIIFAILAFTSKWNIKVEIWFSFALSIVSFILIYRISRISFDKHLYLLVVANALSSLIFFSPIQVENWLWGFQISWFLIISCMISAVYFLSSTNFKYKIFIAASLCLVSSFSSAHGLLTWIALTPLIFLFRNSWKSKLFTLGAWYFGFLVSVILYTIGYQKPNSHPDILFFLKDPVGFLKYFFSLAGSPFNVSQTPIAGILGLLGVSLFLYFNYSFIKSLFRKDRNDDVSRLFQSKIAPWLSIGWFAVLFVLMTSVGRAGFGVGQAASSRYTSMSNLLFISCLQIGLLIYSQRKTYFRKKYFFWQGLLTVLLVGSFFIQYLSGISIGSEYKIQRSHGKQCLELIHYIEIEKFEFDCLQTIYPDVKFIKSNYPTLEKLDFRDFPNNVEFVNTSFSSSSYGYVDYSKNTLIKLGRNDQLSIGGWAALPNESEQPSAVFFSYNEVRSFFATIPVYQSRPDVAKALGSEKYSKSGWSGNVSIDQLPIGDNVVKAWIYNKRANQFIKLNGEITVKVLG